MRFMVEIDDNTINRARRITGIEDAAELTRTCVTQWIQHEAARRLAALGASDPSAAGLKAHNPQNRPSFPLY